MHALDRPLSALALTLAIVSAAACTGEIDHGAGGTQPGGGAASTGGTTTTTTGGGGTLPPQACTAVTPRAPMRRLTRFEYNNSVRDLLGDKTSPANEFPSEASGNGFGNDADQQAVVAALIEAYVTGAERVAGTATAADRIGALAPCATTVNDTTAEAACAKTIAETFTPNAWRRTLTPGEADGLVALFTSVRMTADFPTSVAAMLEAILQSPEFLYKPELGVAVAGRSDVKQPSGEEMATRLAYLFWASTPDDGLRAAAAAGQLTNPAGIRMEAQRLLADPKARDVVRFFFDNLLPISALGSLERDATLYPTFTGKIGTLMRTETQTFLENEIFNGPGTWPGVFTAKYTYVNAELAGYYGLAGVTGDTFQKVMLDPSTHRGGLLTQAGVVSGPVHTNHENPVVRGSFIVQKLMCQLIPRPTGAIAAKVTPPDPNSAATARQRFSTHSTDPVCHACHQNMDPFGFSLENFNVVGLWRDQENGVTIDASGSAPLLGGSFNGAIEMEAALASSEQVQQCFASQWMNFGYGRSLKPEEACGVESVQKTFKDSGYKIQDMLLALTQAEAFLTLPAVPE
jgi:Protein of unknown function (DUF1592)/Protein of unknown function (DUF1588)/Protein of unknown function (DUF1587)/Protein of unknown function (DUF1585)/Protein of unknown function (DUF1595)